jgi:hypothetical protein
MKIIRKFENKSKIENKRKIENRNYYSGNKFKNKISDKYIKSANDQQTDITFTSHPLFEKFIHPFPNYENVFECNYLENR